jgi:hypothetical protein
MKEIQTPQESVSFHSRLDLFDIPFARTAILIISRSFKIILHLCYVVRAKLPGLCQVYTRNITELRTKALRLATGSYFWVVDDLLSVEHHS